MDEIAISGFEICKQSYRGQGTLAVVKKYIKHILSIVAIPKVSRKVNPGGGGGRGMEQAKSKYI